MKPKFIILPLLAFLSIGQSTPPTSVDLVGLNELALRLESNAGVNFNTANQFPEAAERMRGRAEGFQEAAASVRAEMMRLGWDGQDLPRRFTNPAESEHRR